MLEPPKISSTNIGDRFLSSFRLRPIMFHFVFFITFACDPKLGEDKDQSTALLFFFFKKKEQTLSLEVNDIIQDEKRN